MLILRVRLCRMCVWANLLYVGLLYVFLVEETAYIQYKFIRTNIEMRNTYSMYTKVLFNAYVSTSIHMYWSGTE
jgi:hypothetical protein